MPINWQLDDSPPSSAASDVDPQARAGGEEGDVESDAEARGGGGRRDGSDDARQEARRANARHLKRRNAEARAAKGVDGADTSFVYGYVSELYTSPRHAAVDRGELARDFDRRIARPERAYQPGLGAFVVNDATPHPHEVACA